MEAVKQFLFVVFLFFSFQIFVVLMWIVSIAMGLALLYGLFHYNKDNFTVIEPSWLGDLHAATFRTVWGLVLGWITYACLTGWGGTFFFHIILFWLATDCFLLKETTIWTKTISGWIQQFSLSIIPIPCATRVYQHTCVAKLEFLYQAPKIKFAMISIRQKYNVLSFCICVWRRGSS